MGCAIPPRIHRWLFGIGRDQDPAGLAVGLAREVHRRGGAAGVDREQRELAAIAQVHREHLTGLIIDGHVGINLVPVEGDVGVFGLVVQLQPRLAAAARKIRRLEVTGV